MPQVKIVNLLPRGIEPEVLTDNDAVWQKLQATGWAGHIRELVDSTMHEGQLDIDNYTYTVLYDLSQPEKGKAEYGTGKSNVTKPQAKVAGLGFAYVRGFYFARMLYVDCPLTKYMECSHALNKMIQEYMEEFLKASGARGTLINWQKNELDEPSKN